MSMMRAVSLAAVGLGLILFGAACKSGGKEIEITYDLTAVDLAKLARLETIIRVDPRDGRQFFVDQPYRAVAQGIGYEVRDIDGDDVREVILLHEASLGFVFTSTFSFKLLPPATGEPPPLVLSAKAYGPSNALGESTDTSAAYAKRGKVSLTLASVLCDGATCAANQTCCAGHCVATDTDPTNCGGCGMACGANSDGCSGSVCRCNGGAACSGGTSCCPGEGCIDLQNDRFNCGACGKACNPGETCSGGACHCGTGLACGTDGLCCATDTGAECSTTGSCACGGNACASPTICCSADKSLCADVMNDDANCGSCGVACSAGLHCQNGACRCAGQICSGSDSCCVDGCHTLANDELNCGACGRQCKAGEQCMGSACHCGGSTGPTCGDGQACCGTNCVNTQADARNCGGCGHACQPGEDCVNGKCSCNAGSACAPGFTCCANTGCVDLTSDPLHCNACDKACSTGFACRAGNCVKTDCDPVCFVNGNDCKDGVCLCDGAIGNAPCALGTTCCKGAGCKDTSADPANCGGCGNKCPDATPICCGAKCVSSKLQCIGDTLCGGMLCTKDQHCCQGCPVGPLGTPTFSCIPNGVVCPDVICPQ